MPHANRKNDETPKRLRLYAKYQPRLPKPVSANKDRSGFSLKMIERADRRFAVVRRMRERVKLLMEEINCDSKAKEYLAGRAVFLLQYLESKEMDALEGISIDWKEYCSTVTALTATLKALGANEAQRSTQRLADYVIEMEQNGNAKHKKEKKCRR